MKRKLVGLLTSGAMAMAVCIGPAALPAQASTGSVMVAATNLSGGLYYEWQADGSSTWTKELVASGSWTTPAMTVQSDGNVLITAVDYPTRTLYFFWQGYQTTTWHEEQVSATGAAADYEPSMAAQTPMSAGQPADVAIVEQNSNPDGNGNPEFTYYYQQVGQSAWNSQSLPGGYDGQTDPDVTVAPNNTIVVVFDPGIIADNVSGFFIDEQPYLSGSWSNLHVSTGYTENQPQVEVQSSGNIVIADTIGTEGDIQGVEFYWSPADDIDTWYAETVSTKFGAVDEQGVSMADDPAAGTIAITGGSGGTCTPTATQVYGGVPWTMGQIGCPGSFASNPTIAAEGSGALIAADAGPNSGQGYFYWAAKGSTTWHKETLPGLTDVYGEIALTSYMS